MSQRKQENVVRKRVFHGEKIMFIFKKNINVQLGNNLPKRTLPGAVQQ